MKFRIDKNIYLTDWCLYMRCRRGKRKGKVRETWSDANRASKLIDTTAWLIEASHTTWITWWIIWMRCIVLKQSSAWVIPSSRNFEEEGLSPREKYFNFSKKDRNVECDTCSNAFLHGAPRSQRRLRGVGQCAVYNRNTRSGWRSDVDLSLWSC